MAERNEFWWVQIEGRSEVADVYFEGDIVSRFYPTGYDYPWRFEGSPETLTGWEGRANGYSVRFIEPVAQPGAVAQAEAALTRFQDEVWGSLDKYSKKLGWGLTGIQPECWALLDSAVEELVRLREEAKANERWEDAFRTIVTIVRGPQHPFEIGDIVEEVRALKAEVDPDYARETLVVKGNRERRDD